MLNTQYIIASSDNAYANQGLEKYLLEYVEPETVILYLWQNRRTVVIGKNQNAWQECKVAELEADGGLLARRISGGGAVYHDLGNLNFTFVAPKEHYSVARNLAVIVAALRALNIRAEISGRNDITVDGRKISGNAFYEGRSCFHHGTLLISVDMAEMGRYLQVAVDKLQSKGVSSVRSRVANLNEFAPGLNPERMTEALLQAFSAEYGAAPRPLQLGDADRERLVTLTGEFSSREWRLNRPIPCDVELAARYEWGGLTIRLSVNEGRVREAEIFTDSLDPQLPERLRHCLLNQAFSAAGLAGFVERDSGLNAAVAGDICSLLRRQSF